uniref:Uncharacterized protein n=1 Tax=Scleropages formosus TaxID=113540 RepID=A0A8C9SPJ3_SCLFO
MWAAGSVLLTVTTFGSIGCRFDPHLWVTVTCFHSLCACKFLCVCVCLSPYCGLLLISQPGVWLQSEKWTTANVLVTAGQQSAGAGGRD